MTTHHTDELRSPQLNGTDDQGRIRRGEVLRAEIAMNLLSPNGGCLANGIAMAVSEREELLRQLDPEAALAERIEGAEHWLKSIGAEIESEVRRQVDPSYTHDIDKRRIRRDVEKQFKPLRQRWTEELARLQVQAMPVEHPRGCTWNARHKQASSSSRARRTSWPRRFQRCLTRQAASSCLESRRQL